MTAANKKWLKFSSNLKKQSARNEQAKQALQRCIDQWASSPPHRAPLADVRIVNRHLNFLGGLHGDGFYFFEHTLKEIATTLPTIQSDPPADFYGVVRNWADLMHIGVHHATGIQNSAGRVSPVAERDVDLFVDLLDFCNKIDKSSQYQDFMHDPVFWIAIILLSSAADPLATAVLSSKKHTQRLDACFIESMVDAPLWITNANLPFFPFETASKITTVLRSDTRNLFDSNPSAPLRLIGAMAAREADGLPATLDLSSILAIASDADVVSAVQDHPSLALFSDVIARTQRMALQDVADKPGAAPKPRSM